MSFIINLFWVMLLTLISGYGDSQGFLHASLIWHNNKLISSEVVKSSLGFILGITPYWISIRYMQDLGVFSSEIQTIFWFSVTIIGVALSSGKFLRWNLIDQFVAFIVLAGITWLLFRVKN